MARDRVPLPGETYKKEKRKTTKENIILIKRFLPYLKPHIPALATVLFFTAVCAACEIYLPLIVRKLTNTAIYSPGNLTVELIIRVCVMYAFVKATESISSYIETYYGHIMGVKIENTMRVDMFEHLQTLSFTFFDNTKVGQLMSRMTSDLFDVAEWAHHFPEMVFTTVVKFISGFLIFATMDIRFAILVFAMMPFMILLTKRSRMKMRETFRKSRFQIGEINAVTEDNLLGVRVIRSFTNESNSKLKFIDGCHEYVRIKKKNHKYMASFHSTVRLLNGIMYIAVVGSGAMFMRAGITTPGDFAASLLLVSTLIASIRTIIDFSEQFSNGITGLERFLDIMDEEPETKDKTDAVELTDVKGDIEFKNVCFTYCGSENIVLKDFSLSVHHGENIAIVGPSGGGKTTICNLIPRFYIPDSGEILIDGKNTENITLNSLRRNIGTVDQNVYLFSGTIRENILIGRPDATDEEVREAARNAGAEEFILSLPNGYDTYTGERGIKLSGGQRQRIAIARVFLKNPPIILLDEATSALDNESEKLVQESLERLTKGRTTVTVAHRLTTVRNADEIVVLTDNGIAERGNHAELMSRGGIYSKMYDLYASI
ncbi:MAG: ABC transporter ATP-binding protein/permease [Clostridia bacterium]|nr:ABC transporter ATP-binding protein/permease [Clostridia bacterium]